MIATTAHPRASQSRPYGARSTRCSALPPAQSGLRESDRHWAEKGGSELHRDGRDERRDGWLAIDCADRRIQCDAVTCRLHRADAGWRAKDGQSARVPTCARLSADLPACPHARIPACRPNGVPRCVPEIRADARSNLCPQPPLGAGPRSDTRAHLPSDFFFCFLGGVTGLPMLMPPYAYFCFFSAGLRIWNEHSSVSSTLIMAPALSNSPQ